MATPIINSVVSSSKQTKISEESIIMDNLLDMGKIIARNTIIYEMNDLNSDSVDNTFSALDRLNRNLINSDENKPFYNPTFMGQKQTTYYELYFDDIKLDDDKIIISYTINAGYIIDEGNEGNKENIEKSNSQETIEIQLAGKNTDWESAGEWNNLYKNNYQVTNHNEVINGSVAFKAGLKITGSKNLKIRDSLYMLGGEFNLRPNSSLIINGSAYFKNVPFAINKAKVCIEGNIYGVLPPGANSVKNKSCDNVGNGVYYFGEHIPGNNGTGSKTWNFIGAY